MPRYGGGSTTFRKCRSLGLHAGFLDLALRLRFQFLGLCCRI